MTQLIVLNNQDHLNLRVSPHPTSQTAGMNAVSVIPHELPRLLAHFPVFFLKSQESGRFEPVALLGFEVGENLFYANGRWEVDYVPLQIQRQPFGDRAPAWGGDYTDIWWNANESGWGLTLAQHGNNVFGVWYTYGTDGKPLFVVMPGVTFTAPNAFSGTLYTTTGPPFTSASW